MKKAIEKFFNYIGLEVADDEENGALEQEAEEVKVKSISESKKEKSKKPSFSNPSPAPKRNKIFDLAPSVNTDSGSKMQVAVFKPKYFEDIRMMADELKFGKPVIVNFMELTDSSHGRMLDCMSGVLYAIEGELVKISDFIYLASPKGIEAVGNITAEAILGEQFNPLLDRRF